MTKKTVNLYPLFLKQDVKTNSHSAKAGIKIGSHKVGKIEFALWRTYKQWSSFCKSSHMLTGEIAVG